MYVCAKCMFEGVVYRAASCAFGFSSVEPPAKTEEQIWDF